MADEEVLNTGGGSSVQGDANTGGGDLTGRDNVESKATGNVVNIYSQPPRTLDRLNEQEGLSVGAEDRLQQGINNLHTEVSKLSGTIIALTGTLQNEISTSKERTSNLKELVDTISDTAVAQAKMYEDRLRYIEQAYQDLRVERERERSEREKEQRNVQPAFDRRTSNVLLLIALLMLIFLGVIAWASLFRNTVAPTTPQAIGTLVGSAIGLGFALRGKPT